MVIYCKTIIKIQHIRIYMYIYINIYVYTHIFLYIYLYIKIYIIYMFIHTIWNFFLFSISSGHFVLSYFWNAPCIFLNIKKIPGKYFISGVQLQTCTLYQIIYYQIRQIIQCFCWRLSKRQNGKLEQQLVGLVIFF